MKFNGSAAKAARSFAALSFIGAASVALTGLTAGSVDAAVGENLPASCQQFSSDNGGTWGNATVIEWNNSARPVPGGEIKQASFQVKNVCATPAKFQVYAGDWSVGSGGAATVRATAGGVTSTTKQLAGEPGILVVETGRLTADEPITVELFVGIPESVTEQAFKITPDWGTALEEVAADAPTDPGDSGGGSSSGSLDGVTGSSSGSLADLFGSGSAAAVDATLEAPAIISGR